MKIKNSESYFYIIGKLIMYINLFGLSVTQWMDSGHGQLFEKKSFFKKPKTSTKHCSNNTPMHYAQGSH